MIYARISFDADGEERGVNRQLEDCQQIAKDRGWDVVAEYVDNDTSAWKKNSVRPRYDDMVVDFSLGHFDVLLCWDLDRLTRQPRQLEDWIDAAEDRGLRLVTANGEADLANDAGRMFARIKAAVARGEADRMSKRIKRASDQREANGLYHGGTTPFGYTAKLKKDRQTNTAFPLEVNDDEAAVIREAVDRLFAGDTLSGIVKSWQLAGRRTRSRKNAPNGSTWRVTGLRPILRNPAIVGKNKLGEVKWEPIIDQATFDRLQVMFDDPSRRTTISPGVKGGRYSLGGGLVKCAECGHTLTSYKRGKERNRRSGLRCAKYTGGCGRVSIDFARLERYVFDTVVASLGSNERWKQRTTLVHLGEVNKKVAELDVAKRELDEQAKRATNAYVAGLMPEPEMRAHVTRIKSERKEIEAEVGRLLGSTQIDKAIGDGLTWESWNEWTPERRRNFLRLLLDRIVISRWPTDVPKGLPKRRTETSEQHRARFEVGQRNALIKRVEIVAKG